MRRLSLIACQVVLIGALVAVFLGLVNSSVSIRAGIALAAPFCSMILLGVAIVICLAQIGCSKWGWQFPSVFAKASPWLSRAKFPLLAAGVIILFIVPLVHAWTQLVDPCGAVGGYLPFSDAVDYWQGAQYVETQGQLDSWNCRRPLNALLLAVRLAIMGNDLRGALILQAALLGLSCFFLARTLAREFGAGPALLLFAILFAIGREFIASTQSEALGLTLGTLATAILWSAARDRSMARIALGLFFLTLALNARAGAFLVLPALVIWAGLALGKNQRWLNWRAAGLAMAAIAVGFLMNGALRGFYGVGFGVGHGNFSTVLYGFSTGQPDWTRIYTDHPEIKTNRFSSQDEVNSYIYACAWENICRSPFVVVRAYARSLTAFLSGFKTYGFGFFAFPKQFDYLLGAWLLVVCGRFFWIQWRGKALRLALVAAVAGLYLGRRLLGFHGLIHFLFQLGLLLGVLRYLWLMRHDGRTGLLLFALAGFLLSGPIVYPDGSNRVLVASFPLTFLLVALAPVGWNLPSEKTENLAAQEPAGVVWLPLAASAGLLLAAWIGPTLAFWGEQGHPLISTMIPQEGNTWCVRVGPQTPHLDILEPAAKETTFVPQVRDEDFSKVLAGSAFGTHYPNACAHFQGPSTIFLAVAPTNVFVVGPPGMIEKQTRLLRVQGTLATERGQSFFFVSNWQPWLD